jgi:hypothetical protein
VNDFTLVVPYYRNPEMLRAQAALWRAYPPGVRIIVVDDGSPEPAAPILAEVMGEAPGDVLQCYRIAVDIPWNRGGARNLGTPSMAADRLGSCTSTSITCCRRERGAGAASKRRPDPDRVGTASARFRVGPSGRDAHEGHDRSEARNRSARSSRTSTAT